MLLAASKEAVSYGANTFMIYTGAPQNTRRKPIEELNIDQGLAHMKQHGIEEIVVHAPYIINIGNTINADTFSLGVSFYVRKSNEQKRLVRSSSSSILVRTSVQARKQALQNY